MRFKTQQKSTALLLFPSLALSTHYTLPLFFLFTIYIDLVKNM